MPRVPRLDYPGAIHHVMNRGARHAPIFGDDDAKQLFLNVLAEVPDRFGVQLHTYALMPNHYHLVLACPQGNLARAMRHLGAVFTQRLNRQMDWDGPVFRGRYHNRLVCDDRYWDHLVAYVNLNPVPLLVQRPEGWPWSSYRALIGLDDDPPWLYSRAYRNSFGSREQIRIYVEEHFTGVGTVPHGFDPNDLWTADTSDTFNAPLTPMKSLTEAVAEAMVEVAQVTGRPTGSLLINRRGRRDNRARWVMAWWLVHRAGMPHRRVSFEMDCSAGAVANMLHRLRNLEDPEVGGWMSSLEALRRYPG